MILPSEIFFSSKNEGKIAELRKLLQPFGITVRTATDDNLPDVAETGTTFHENALLKAAFATQTTGLPALADDSGLCVNALGGGPGLYTARYGTYKRLLEDMKDVPTGERGAHFICVLAYTRPNEEPSYFEGRVDGHITHDAQGGEGFAYDPVFIPQGWKHTYAEMTPQKKAETSHRQQALTKFLTFISQAKKSQNTFNK